MKIYLKFLLAVFFISCGQKTVENFQTVTVENTVLQPDSTYLFKANPKEGFNYDYYLYMPEGIDKSIVNTLIIETTNTGLNDSIEYHRKGAKHAASKSSVGNFVAKKLNIPLLVPVFPRSETNWQIYSHALDSETFNIKNSELERLDLQLLAMFENAKEELKKRGYRIKDRFFMTGFSASGTFANRFAVLHPKRIEAVSAGGVNSILILPLEEYGGRNLNFPIGINDVEAVTGNKFDLRSFQELPQFWFMGENDNNDAAKFDDAYNQQERELIYSILGEQMPERWKKIQMIYEEENIPATFKTYEDIGHGTDLRINNEVAEFFKQYR